MKIKELLKEIDGVFIPPVKRYYFGWLRYGTPYFNPINFCPTIFFIRKLKRNSQEKINEYLERYSHYKPTDDNVIYSNIPMVRRSKSFIFKDWYVEFGSPFKIVNVRLGWKDKFDSPRFEWSPSFMIFFFGLQFVTFWHAPNNNDDTYWEMILWWLNYSKKDLEKAKKTWSWVSHPDKITTWNEDYLIKK